MTVTINLPAEIEASLVAPGHARGLKVPQLVEIILREKVYPVRKQKELSPEKKAAAWLEGAKRFPHTLPLSDEAISRENLYETRG